MSEDATAIDRNAPLRLARAAEIAFPDGGMTASGLRREAERGNLQITRVAGKDFTTLRAIARPLRLPRLKEPADPRNEPPGGAHGRCVHSEEQRGPGVSLRKQR